MNLKNVKDSAKILLDGGSLFAGDGKASYRDLLTIASGNAIKAGDKYGTGRTYQPTPAETAAASVLIENYLANGGKGGGSALDLMLDGGTDFNQKHFKNVHDNIKA